MRGCGWDFGVDLFGGSGASDLGEIFSGVALVGVEFTEAFPAIKYSTRKFNPQVLYLLNKPSTLYKAKYPPEYSLDKDTCQTDQQKDYRHL